MKRVLFVFSLLFALIGWLPSEGARADELQLFLSQSCSTTQTGLVTVNFTWQGEDAANRGQWIELSNKNDNWQAGTSRTSGLLTDTTSDFTWNGLAGLTAYYVRVNQWQSAGIATTGSTFTFTSLDCGTPTGAVSNAIAALATLNVQDAAPMTGYSRAQFGPAWEDVDHNGCDTRNNVLQRDLTNAVLRTGSKCIVQTGTLQDPYTGKAIAFVRGVGTSDDVQIDHMVALGDAWQTGAAQWDSAKRLRYANDPDHLLAVDGPANESKGDRDAAQWLPPDRSFDCPYVMAQVDIKAKYMLWVTQAEHDAMAGVLKDCAASPPEPDGHTWYTSVASQETTYSCDLDDDWKSTSPSVLRTFGSQSDLLVAFPGRTKSLKSHC